MGWEISLNKIYKRLKYLKNTDEICSRVYSCIHTGSELTVSKKLKTVSHIPGSKMGPLHTYMGVDEGVTGRSHQYFAV